MIGRLTLVIAAFPALMPFGFLVVGPVQVIEVAALLIIGVVFAERLLTTSLVPPPGPAAFAVVGVVSAAMAATPLSMDEDATFRAVTQLAGGVLLALAVHQGLDRLAALSFVLWGIVVSGGVMAVIALSEAGEQEAAYGGAVVTGRAAGVFAQPNEMGLFAAMVLMVALALAASAPSRTGRAIASLVALVLLGALALSLSRGAWLGAVAGLGGLAILLPSARRWMLGLTLGLGVTVSAASALLPHQSNLRIVTSRLGTLANQVENPYDERPEIYALALRLVRDRPAVGQGPGTFPVAAESSIRWGWEVEAEHAHNALLTVAAETGLAGVGAVVSLTLAVMVLLIRVARDAHVRGDVRAAGVAAGLGASLLVMVVHGVIDYPLRNPVIFLLAWLLVGCAFAVHRAASPTRTGALP